MDNRGNRIKKGKIILAAKGAHVADEAAKWLDWPAYLALVETLRRECAPLTHLGWWLVRGVKLRGRELDVLYDETGALY